MKRYWVIIILLINAISSCNWFKIKEINADNNVLINDSVQDVDSIMNVKDNFPVDATRNRDTALLPPSQIINTGNVQPNELMAFAESLVGVPYEYASTNPNVGFDCSGFITYVFNHFNISVPRSSIDFTDVGKAIQPEEAKRGDIILFTGTDSTELSVGHMGLIVSNNNKELQFIHSSSGKAYGVTITPLNAYYKSRFVKVIRIFPQNDQ